MDGCQSPRFHVLPSGPPTRSFAARGESGKNAKIYGAERGRGVNPRTYTYTYTCTHIMHKMNGKQAHIRTLRAER